MKRFIGYSLLLMVFVLSGCVMRVTSYEVDRVDQEIEGNRGMLKGTPSASSATKVKKTKTMYNLEIEMPSLLDFEELKPKPKRAHKDQEVYGNKGYVSRSSITKLKTQPTKKKFTFFGRSKSDSSETSGKVSRQESAEILQEIYIVKKGDTLQKISNKFYGTTKKWKKIYEANKKTLKAPDLIKKGQKLIIPMN